VMLTPVGDVKVMDFGIARAMSDASSTMTQTQAVIGTAQYLSPEQARGEQVDTRSDLYSAGCLLYELLTGRPPFVADSPVAVAYQHVREAPVPPSRVVPGIPDSVDRIVLHSLSKGRDERYQTAADFRSDVEAARGGRQISAVPAGMYGSNATTQYVPVQDPTGTRIAPAAAMGGGALLGAAAAGQGDPNDPYNQYGQNPYGQQPDPYGQQQYGQADPYNQGDGNDYGRRQQREQEQSSSNWKMIVAGIAVVVVVALIAYLVSQQFQTKDPGDSAATTFAVPKVEGKLLTEAQEELAAQGFTNVTVAKKSSSADNEDKIIKQDPAADTLVAKTAAITITVGTGPNTVDVPDLSGKTQEEALAALEEAGLRGGAVSTQDSASVDRDKVIKSDPGEGESVKRNTAVKLIVSSGQVRIPDLIDKTQADARSALNKLGLKARFQTEFSEADPGTVTRTEPDAGQRVDQGSTVDVYIAKKDDREPTQEPTEEPTGTPSPTPTVPTPSLTLPGQGGGGGNDD
jgi:eukaryotic-like serine/threonine-protein kinase